MQMIIAAVRGHSVKNQNFEDLRESDRSYERDLTSPSSLKWLS